MTDMRLVDAIELYWGWRRRERGSSDESRNAVRHVLWRMEARYRGSYMSEFNPPNGTHLIRMWLEADYGSDAKNRYGQPISQSTMARSVSYVRGFFQWAYDEDLVTEDPTRKIRRPKHAAAICRRPTEDEIDAVYAAALSWEKPAILLMGWLGMRVSEVVACKWAHVDFLNGTLLIPQRKGGVPQTLPLYDDVKHRLYELNQTLEPGPDDFLFVAREKRISGGRDDEILTTDAQRSRHACYSLVKRAAERAGVGPFLTSAGRARPLSPHLLRHGAASRMLRAEVPIDVVQFMLGHKQIATTKRYLDELRVESVGDVLNRRLGVLSEAGALPVGAREELREDMRPAVAGVAGSVTPTKATSSAAGPVVLPASESTVEAS